MTCQLAFKIVNVPADFRALGSECCNDVSFGHAPNLVRSSQKSSTACAIIPGIFENTALPRNCWGQSPRKFNHLRTNSLHSETGNFQTYCREYFSANREIIAPTTHADSENQNESSDLLGAQPSPITMRPRLAFQAGGAHDFGPAHDVAANASRKLIWPDIERVITLLM